MLQYVYGDGALIRSRIFERLRLFRDDRKNVQDDPPISRPIYVRTPETIKKVPKPVTSDRPLTIQLHFKTVYILKEVVQQ